MSTNIVSLNVSELDGIEKSKADKIRETFTPMADMLEKFEESFNEVMSESKNGITADVSAKAKRLRLDISKVRIETGKLKDKQKEYIKLEDRAIMGVHNILVFAVKEKEDKLKEIEDFQENQEKERLKALQSVRVEILSKYVDDASERDLSGMDNDVWEAYLSAKKRSYEDLIAAEAQAEKARKEEEEKVRLRNRRTLQISPFSFFMDENHAGDISDITDEEFNSLLNGLKAKKEAYDKKQDEIRVENERLKEEVKKVEAKVEAERKEQERIKAEEEMARKEREDKIESENRAKLAEEKRKRELVELELNKQKEEEKKREEEAIALDQAELKKGDEAKVRDLILDMEQLKTKYVFKSDRNKKMYADTGVLIDKIIAFVNEQISK